MPFAIAPTRPRSFVYRWRIRSASAKRSEVRTTASVLYDRAIVFSLGGLAVGAVRRATAADPRARDRRPAPLARLAGASVGTKPVLHPSALVRAVPEVRA